MNKIKRGRSMHVPMPVIREIYSIKDEDRITNYAEALKQMARYSQVGRKASRIGRLDWSYLGKMPSIPKPDPKYYEHPLKKNKKYKKASSRWQVEM
jgi:hypothetical protein